MKRPSLSHRAVLGVLVAAAVAVSGCTSGSSAKLGGKPLKLKPVFEATKALGKLDTTGEVRNGSKGGRITGAYDYLGALADLSFPVIAPVGQPRARYLAKGKEAWLGRATYSGTPPKDPYAAALLPPPGVKTWISTGPGLSYVVAITGAYDPATLALYLNLNEVAMLKSGTDTVKGAKLDHYRATLTAAKPTLFHLKAVDLWINAKNQLVQVKLLTAADNVVTYTVRRRTAAVEVTPPAPDQIANQGSTNVGPELTGPYQSVANGDAAGVAFTVEQAPAQNGFTCWRVQSTPAFVPASKDRQDGARCTAAPTGTDPTDQVSFPVDAGAGNPFELLGGVLPAGATATLTMTDGSTRPFTRGPAGIALYSGPPEPGAAFIAVTLASGEKLACGPGPISALIDVEGSSASDLAPQPWSCAVP